VVLLGARGSWLFSGAPAEELLLSALYVEARVSKARPPARFVSLTDAAAYVGCDVITIRRRIADGTITGYRLGNRNIRVDLRELDRLLKPIPSTDAG
jgi:excisionase family DNA binding protein